jgi:hypothetical protein
MCVTIPSMCRIHRMSLGLVYINSGNCHMIWFYSCSYTGINIQHKVSSSLFAHLDNSMCVIIPSWCRIHCTSLGLVHINTGRCLVLWFYRCSYTGIWIQLNVSPSLFAYLDNSMCVIIHSWCRIHRTSLGLVYINTGPCQVIWFYCCSYKGICIQLNVSSSIFRILSQCDVRYNPLLVPYTLHVTHVSPYKHWSLSWHMILLLSIYRYM